jgi:hypothetical protein
MLDNWITSEQPDVMNQRKNLKRPVLFWVDLSAAVDGQNYAAVAPIRLTAQGSGNVLSECSMLGSILVTLCKLNGVPVRMPEVGHQPDGTSGESHCLPANQST